MRVHVARYNPLISICSYSEFPALFLRCCLARHVTEYQLCRVAAVHLASHQSHPLRIASRRLVRLHRSRGPPNNCQWLQRRFLQLDCPRVAYCRWHCLICECAGALLLTRCKGTRLALFIGGSAANREFDNYLVTESRSPIPEPHALKNVLNG